MRSVVERAIAGLIQDLDRLFEGNCMAALMDNATTLSVVPATVQCVAM